MITTLEDSLKIRREGTAANAPTEIYKIMRRATSDLKISGIEKAGPKLGEIFPNFNLPDQNGNIQTLSKLLENGKVVLVYYRGGWCPYCNMELRAYQKYLNEIKSLGAQLVAITPEIPDESLSTQEKNELTFTILTDEKLKFTRTLDLVFTVPEDLKPIYESFGINLEKHNGKDQFDLPIPATYIIDESGKVISRYLNADYTYRQEPSDIIEVLKKL